MYRQREAAMAVRDVVDEKGTKWKVWSVETATFHPKTAAEDFLGDYADGWLCFEAATQRRRLALFPKDWGDLSDKGVLELLKKAEIVTRRNTPPKAGESASP
jgi:hypothetical protein